MDTETQNQITNNGLGCINIAANTLISSVLSVQNDLAHNDVITGAKDALHSLQTLEESVLPQCAYAYWQLASYLEENADESHHYC